MTAIIDDIFSLFARFGSKHYGEDVSFETHMLQSAAMAESLGAAPSLVAAALLHDIGYFLRSDAEALFASGQDFAHETVGAEWLSQAFGADITAPIALHVPAKRYLCAVDSDYFAQLSNASRLSFAAQGGPFTEREAAVFAQDPAFEAALLLRRCDDGGKDAALETRNIERFRALLTNCLRRD